MSWCLEPTGQLSLSISRNAKAKSIDVKITKRPLFRPSIPSPYSGRQNQKIVYISSKTPFVSAVKRVRRLLYLAEKRDLQAQISAAASTSTASRPAGAYGRGGSTIKGKPGNEFAALDALNSVNARYGAGGKRKPEEVLIKATGKAIEKAMNMALFFQQQKDCAVVVRTGSVHAIDDIEVVKDTKKRADETAEEDLDKMNAEEIDSGKTIEKGGGDADAKGFVGDNDGPHIPETRIRQTSVLEVAITLN